LRSDVADEGISIADLLHDILFRDRHNRRLGRGILQFLQQRRLTAVEKNLFCLRGSGNGAGAEHKQQDQTSHRGRSPFELGILLQTGTESRGPSRQATENHSAATSTAAVARWRRKSVLKRFWKESRYV